MTAYHRDDYIRYRIERAKETLVEVEKHIENCFWNTAVNRLYYACFYAVSALLLKNNIEVSSHSGVRQKFGQLFVKTEKFDKDLANTILTSLRKGIKGITMIFTISMRKPLLISTRYPLNS
ncbi:MAG TPA: HEPN domain-containing protein [Tenuifilaceae bacterium]|nr:HEPN domain-containing protein [Tenuifilaceae bacterium]